MQAIFKVSEAVQWLCIQWLCICNFLGLPHHKASSSSSPCRLSVVPVPCLHVQWSMLEKGIALTAVVCSLKERIAFVQPSRAEQTGKAAYYKIAHPAHKEAFDEVGCPRCSMWCSVYLPPV